LIWIFNTEGSM